MMKGTYTLSLRRETVAEQINARDVEEGPGQMRLLAYQTAAAYHRRDNTWTPPDHSITTPRYRHRPRPSVITAA